MNVVPLPRAGPYQDEPAAKWFLLPEDLSKVFRLGLARFSDEPNPRVVLQVAEDVGHQAMLGLTPSQAYALGAELKDAAELAWPYAAAGGEAEQPDEAVS